MNYGEALAYLDAHATYEKTGRIERRRRSSAMRAADRR